MGSFSFEGFGSNTVLVYTVGADEEIDTLSLGMMTNNKIPGILESSYQQLDGTSFIRYKIIGKICAKDFLTGVVNKKRVLGLFKGVCEAMLSAENYMLDMNSIPLDLEYIYSDVATCDASMVCIPVMQPETNSVPDLAGFFRNFLFTRQYDVNESNDYVTIMVNYINSTPMFSLVEFKKLVDDLLNGASGQVTSPQTAASQSASAPVQAQPSNMAPAPAPSNQAPTPVQVSPAPQEVTPVSVKQMGNPVHVTPVQQATSQAPAQPASEAKKLIPDIPSSVNIPGLGAVNAPEKKSGFGGLFGGKDKDKAKGAASSVAPAAATPAPAPAPQKPEKKGLFGGKKESAPAPASMGGMAIPGMEIPGMSAAPKASASPTPAAAPAQQVATPVQQAAPAHNSMQQAPQKDYGQANIIQTGGMNFGNTISLAKDGSASSSATTFLKQGSNASVFHPYLIRKKNDERINISTSPFHIGKEASYATYCVVDNPAVSRAHADLVIVGEKVFVVDTNSSNGTFINRRQINANQQTPLSHGDTIVFADEEFSYYEY